MKYVIIIDMSAGNESIGEMWQETHIFDGETSLNDVMDKVLPDDIVQKEYSRKRITITKPHPEDRLKV
mgnify:CR=1 FL=1